MTRYVQEIVVFAAKYGLKISGVDASDVTLIARLELLPSVFIQIYRNSQKNKLNLALILGNSRIYGFDSEGGITHQHPLEDPESHILIGQMPEIEEFILESLAFLKKKDLI